VQGKKGLLTGIELATSHISSCTFGEVLAQHGILSKEAHETVIRFSPPQIINQEQIDWAIE